MVSIIIVSFNTKDLLNACLSSIQNYLKGIDYEIIVVDNASKDGSADMVKKEFPNVVLVENEKNLGFGKANNIGAKKAKGEAILFLNSDTQLVDDSLKKMVTFVSQNEKIGAVGGQLKNSNGAIEQSARRFYSLFNLFLMLFGLERVGFVRHRGAQKEVDWVSGGYMLVKRSLFNNLSGFDEQIFMYTEDMEFCYRVRKKGYQVWYFPSSYVLHTTHGSASRGFAIEHIYKGILYFYKKHRSSVEYTIARVLLMIKAVVALGIGMLINNNYLKTTYRKALRGIL